MSSPRSSRGDKPLERVKKAIWEYGYEKLLELYDPDPDTQKIKYEKDKVRLTRLGGTRIGVYKATYYSETKREYYFILRMLPNEAFREYYFAIRQELNDATFIPMQYESIPVTIEEHEYVLEIIEDCGQNSSLDKFFTSSRVPRKTSSMVLSCAQQILNMMQSLISIGYIWTDHKPSNYFVNLNGYIIKTDEKSTLKIKKHHAYRADEIATTLAYQSSLWEEWTNKKTQITNEQLLLEISYRVGITLYEIATGHIVTEQCKQLFQAATDRADRMLSNYKTLMNTLNEDDTLKNSLEDLETALEAQKNDIIEKKPLKEFNISLQRYEQAGHILSIKAELNERIGTLLMYARNYLAAISEKTTININSEIQLHRLSEKTDEEKALRKVISKMLEPNPEQRMSLTEAYALITTSNFTTLPSNQIPPLPLSTISGSSSTTPSSSSPSHSPTITPNSSSSRVSSQSGSPPTPGNFSSNAFLFTSSIPPVHHRERSATIATDNTEAPPMPNSRASVSPKRKTKHYLPLKQTTSSGTLLELADHKDKKNGTTVASSSSTLTFFETTGRPRSNTEITFPVQGLPLIIEHKKSLKGKKVTSVPAPTIEELPEYADQVANLKSASAPAIRQGNTKRRR